MASILSLVPANYLENLLVTNPNAQSFYVGGILYSRTAILAQFNASADPTENTVKTVGIASIPAAPKTQVLVRADVK